jgi:hypothetical protein
MPLTATHQSKRKPLWQLLDPVRNEAAAPVVWIEPPPKPGGQKSRVVCLAEPNRGFGQMIFDSIGNAADFMKCSESNISEAIRTGHRAARRLWWYADRPLSDRPVCEKSYMLPVVVGRNKYPNPRDAADAIGMDYRYFLNRLQYGYIVRRTNGRRWRERAQYIYKLDPRELDRQSISLESQLDELNRTGAAPQPV